MIQLKTHQNNHSLRRMGDYVKRNMSKMPKIEKLILRAEKLMGSVILQTRYVTRETNDE